MLGIKIPSAKCHFTDVTSCMRSERPDNAIGHVCCFGGEGGMGGRLIRVVLL